MQYNKKRSTYYSDNKNIKDLPMTSAKQSDSPIVCLVAGGGGFVGSHLIRLLLDQGCKVYCLDNFVPQKPNAVDQYKDNPNFSIIDHDLTQEKIPRIQDSLDYVFHVAGVEAYTSTNQNEVTQLLTQAFGTKALLELAHTHRAKFLLASTESIYHESNCDYFGESLNQEHESLFVEAKQFAEAITVEYARGAGLDSRIVRLAFLYGPGMTHGGLTVVGKMFTEAVTQQIIRLPNDGLTPVYPTYIADAVYGLLKAMFSQSSKGKLYGVVQPEPVTLLNLAYQIRSALNNAIDIRFYPTALPLRHLTIPKEVIKSQEALGWFPRETLESGVKKTLEWLTGQPQTQTAFSSQSPAESRSQLKPVDQRSHGSASYLDTNKTATRVYQPPPVFSERVKKISQRTPPILTIQPPVVTVSFKKVVAGFLKKLNPLKSKYALRFAVVSVGLLSVIVGPHLVFSLLVQAATGEISKVVVESRQNRWENVSHHLNNHARWQEAVQPLSKVVLAEYSLLNIDPPQRYVDYLNHQARVTQVFASLNSAKKVSGEMVDVMYGRETGDMFVKIQNFKLRLNEAYEGLGYLEAETKSKTSSYSWLSQLSELRQEVKAYLQLAELAPDVLSLDGKKIYLILLQDSNELRPTGGFIEAVAFITVDKGKILDIQVKDVYSLDKQLSGVVEPPEEVAFYLQEKRWLLQDANISPDFTGKEGAARAAWFVEKETGITADGVAAVNLQFFKKMLGSLGPLFLPEFNETITTENIFERSLYHVNSNMSGENASKSFYTALSLRLFEKIKALPSNEASLVTLPIHQAFSERDLIVWLPDTKAAQLLYQWGWDGGLRKPPEQAVEFGTFDVSDYLSVNEANFGINKANYYITRSLDHTVTVDATGKMEQTTQLTLTNNCPSDTWPGGAYKSLVRFIIPQGARIKKLSTGEPDQLVEVEESNITLKEISGKTEVGVFITVPKQSRQVVELVYQTDRKLPQEKNQVVYGLYLQKQSGVSSTPVRVTISYPLSLKPVKLTKTPKLSPGTIVFDFEASQDEMLAVSFSR